jgi:uncharacterized protein YcbX
MSEITVSELNIYPVKSLAGISLTASKVDLLGLAHDRQWMVVDENGRFMTQRTHPQMALISAWLNDDGLVLHTAGKANLQVVVPTGDERIAVKIWNDVVQASPTDPDADWWFSELLGEPCQLVFFPPEQCRQVDETYAQQGDHTTFSDGFPVLLISQASLDDLNARLETPVPMKRFRPNIVVSGTAPFAEDEWNRVRIGDVEFRVVKPCSRCAVTTVDPLTGKVSGAEPLQTLSTYRLQGSKIMFGQNLIPDGRGTLHLVDEVTLLA